MILNSKWGSGRVYKCDALLFERRPTKARWTTLRRIWQSTSYSQEGCHPTEVQESLLARSQNHHSIVFPHNKYSLVWALSDHLLICLLKNCAVDHDGCCHYGVFSCFTKHLLECSETPGIHPSNRDIRETFLLICIGVIFHFYSWQTTTLQTRARLTH